MAVRLASADAADPRRRVELAARCVHPLAMHQHVGCPRGPVAQGACVRRIRSRLCRCGLCRARSARVAATLSVCAPDSMRRCGLLPCGEPTWRTLMRRAAVAQPAAMAVAAHVHIPSVCQEERVALAAARLDDHTRAERRDAHRQWLLADASESECADTAVPPAVGLATSGERDAVAEAGACGDHEGVLSKAAVKCS